MGDKRSCKNCLFGDTCKETHVCSDYAPVELTDRYIEKLIEKERRSFAKEWLKYVNEYSD